MKKRQFILIILIIILLLGEIIIIFIDIINKSEIEEFKMDVVIGNHIGINLDPDAIHFGIVKKGEISSITREIIVSNIYDINKKIHLITSGKISKFVTLSENIIFLSPNENKTIQLMLKLDPKMDYGKYNGILKAVFK